MNDINTLLQSKQPLLIYDGQCALCSHLVQFFLRREKNTSMHFAALHSESAALILKYFEIGDQTDSMVLIRNYQAYIKSCAALRLCWYMKGLWPLLTVFLLIPPFIRNAVYDFIARRRLKWFGLRESCMNIKGFDPGRFLD
ncbi:MAG TPA: DUF393 domain-containing protein [Bacteroidia bacterium]|nr:DUF393 domain-containing protein [Bacteroidia bacterium]